MNQETEQAIEQAEQIVNLKRVLPAELCWCGDIAPISLDKTAVEFAEFHEWVVSQIVSAFGIPPDLLK